MNLAEGGAGFCIDVIKHKARSFGLMQNTIRWRFDSFLYTWRRSQRNNYLNPLLKWQLMQLKRPVLVHKPSFDIRIDEYQLCNNGT